jgi:CubicO group peptidase (beta-lactamase class C family)
MPRSTLARLLPAALLPLAAACGAKDTGPTGGGTQAEAGLTPVAQTEEWPASTPTAEGMDTAVLADLVRGIRHGGHGTLQTLLVVRHGRLVVEEYFNGWSRDQAHTLQSDTKSVTSLVAGIAAGEGALDVNQPVTGFFPEYPDLRNLDARKRAMRVEDLLTMRTGLDWSEDPYAGSPLQALNESTGDWLRLVLDWPMRSAPGGRWEYNSGGVIVLAGIVGHATGTRMDLYARRRLFDPLGMQGEWWYYGHPDSLVHAGGGLNLRARDLAKLGQLVLDGGRWRGTQVVPEAWIRRATTRTVHSPRTLGAHPVDYGYLWWIASLDDPMNPHPRAGDVYLASGVRGQWLFVVPAYDLVVASNADSDDAHWADAFDFLYTHVLPSIR